MAAIVQHTLVITTDTVEQYNWALAQLNSYRNNAANKKLTITAQDSEQKRITCTVDEPWSGP